MILDRFRLDGQVALVTGGTRGIGLAIAKALGEVGAKVFVTGRSIGKSTERAFKDAGVNYEFVEAELLTEGVADRVVAETAAKAGRLDILVNNAGIAIHGDSGDYPDQTFRNIMTLNVEAVFRACRAALQPMRRQKKGVILNVGSISGIVSNIPQNQVAYNSSKAAVHMMTRSLASELAAENIRVNAVAPGYIETDLSRGGIEDPEMFPVWQRMTPMARVGQPDEVAAAALFLCSDAASYVTGEVLVIDGGYTTR
jgi:NAD(P)-dependent dehydrogenase (short-subunit alcohol dehydrogenase family)